MPTTSKSAPARPAAKKTTGATTVDRVAELKKFFKDYAAGKEKSATYKNEVDSASKLHLLVALEAAGKIQAYEKWENAIKKIGVIDVVNKYNETALHWAAVAQDRALSLELLGAGANVNAISDFGSPLHYQAAAGFSHTHSQALLNAGADPTLRDKQKKTPLNYIDTRFKKFFQQQVEESKVEVLARQIRAGRLPSLTLDQMSSAIDGALRLHAASFEYEANPSFYLQTNGVNMLFGTPHCSTCKMSFGDEKKYARHMMSIDHILKYTGTTEAAMLEARAYLEAKDTFHSVYQGRMTIEKALTGYPEGAVMNDWHAFIEDDKEGNVCIYLQQGSDTTTRELFEMVEHDVKETIPGQADDYLLEAEEEAKSRNLGEEEEEEDEY